MTRIGLVGIGFMGWIHYPGWKRAANAKLAAVCSRDAKKRAGDWRGIRGNFGPPGEQVDLTGVKAYEKLDELLADPDIDLVDVCLPNHLHPETVIAALNAGKHVLVEKAIALRPEQADAMLGAAARSGKVLMVAQVLPFFPEFRFAAEAVRSGRHGKLLAAQFKRVISRPEWSAEMADPSLTGGPAIDLHIHDTHFIGLLCGVPRQVFSTGFVEGDTVRHLATQYLYGPGGPSVCCVSGDLCQKGREFVHGYEIYLERATLVYESGATPLTVLTADGKAEQPKLEGGDDPITAFAAELTAAAEGAASGRAPDLLSAELARDALVMCHKECESVRTGKAVDIA